MAPSATAPSSRPWTTGPSTNSPNLQGNKGPSVGSWKAGNTGSYTLTLADGEKTLDVEALVDGSRLTFSRGTLALVFDK